MNFQYVCVWLLSFLIRFYSEATNKHTYFLIISSSNGVMIGIEDNLNMLFKTF